MALNWPIPAGDAVVAKNCHSGHARRDLLEQFQPLRADAVFENDEPGRVASGPRQTPNDAGTDRVSDIHEYDGHRARRLLYCKNSRRRVHQDDIRRKCHQFCGRSTKALGIARRPTDSRSAHCDLRSSLIRPALVRMPQRGEAIPDRPRWCS